MYMTKLCFAATLASAFVAVGAQARDFRSADVHVREYPTVQAVEYMGKLIGEKTKGKYGVKVFVSSTLGSENDVAEQASYSTRY